MVRGPGSAIYGADAFTGVISLNTYEPTRNEGEFLVSTNSKGTNEFSVRTSHDIDTNQRISANFSVSGQDSQDLLYQSRQLVGIQRRDESWQAGTGLLKWSSKSTNQDRRYSFTFLSHQWEIDEAPGFAAAMGPFLGAQTDNLFADTRFNFYKASFEEHLSRQRLLETNIFYWSSHWGYQMDAAPPTDQQIIGRRDTRTGIQFRLKQPEMTSNRTRWVFGLDIDRLAVNQTYVGFRSTGTSPDNFEGLRNTIKGVFYQGKSRIGSDNLFVHYGLRYDQYPGFGAHATPRLGFVFRPDVQTSLKAVYGNAFRPPSAGEVQGFLGGTTGDPMINPEEIDTFELIYMKKSGSSKLNLTYFENRWTDGIQIQGGAPRRFQNFEKNSSSGLEMSYRKKVGLDWVIDLSVSRISGVNESTDQEYGAYPRYSFNIQTRRESIKSPWTYWFGARILKNWKDSTGSTSPFAVVDELPSYIRFDLGLNYQVSHRVQSYFWVRNLFDRDLKVPSLLDSEIGVPEQGRAVGVGIRISF